MRLKWGSRQLQGFVLPKGQDFVAVWMRNNLSQRAASWRHSQFATGL